MPKYIVSSPGGRTTTVEAKDSTQAKHKVCQVWGHKASDPWCGITALKAKLVRE